MKKFNIEDLERKTPYELPDNFFEEMQKNVLQKTQEKIQQKTQPKAKIISINFGWISVVAASLLLIFGIIFLMNQDKISQTNDVVVAKTEKPIPQTNTTNKVETPKIPTKEEQIYQNIAEEILSTENSEVPAPKKLAVSETSKNSNTTSFSSEEMDLMLNSLTDEDLENLITKNEPDVYLDLYQ